MSIENGRQPHSTAGELSNYSKARKYVDISGGTNLTPPLARIVSSPIRDVQVIVDFTIMSGFFMEVPKGFKTLRDISHNDSYPNATPFSAVPMSSRAYLALPHQACLAVIF